ncbi:AbrB/MazE/SpoVT family DNA-binding domain-containing protein [Methanobrevibacter sp.]|uniref:AbrB/MazE/SpoVT family DNA-binding domain-containing protein n=1 Tax=Methanobrevibacter sp. TaxID=66852 RepID=UPI00386DF9B0
MFKYKSKVGIANKRSNSLRVGVPKEIVKLLELSPGDSVEWDVDVTDNEITVITSKAK